MTKFAPHVAVLIGLLISAIAVWNRRVEIASNLHAGSTRASTHLQHLADISAWSIPACALAWTLDFYVALVTSPIELASLAARSAEIAAGFVGGSLVGATCGVLAVREGRLWRYVKSRWTTEVM